MACGDPPRPEMFRGEPLGYIARDAHGLAPLPNIPQEAWDAAGFEAGGPLLPPLQLVPYTPPSDDLFDALRLMMDAANLASHPVMVVHSKEERMASAGAVSLLQQQQNQRLLDVVRRYNLPAPTSGMVNEDGVALNSMAHPINPLPDGACEHCGLVHAPGHPPRWCRDYVESRPPAVFDFDSIRNRVAQLNGDAPSGRYFREIVRRAPGDKRVIAPTALVEDGHDWDWLTDSCLRCKHTAMGVMEGFAPKICPGKVIGELCVECGEHAVQSAQAMGARMYKVWCLACGHGVWRERDKGEGLKLRPMAKGPRQLGHAMVDAEAHGGTSCKSGTICNDCLHTHTHIVNNQLICDGPVF